LNLELFGIFGAIANDDPRLGGFQVELRRREQATGEMSNAGVFVVLCFESTTTAKKDKG